MALEDLSNFLGTLEPNLVRIIMSLVAIIIVGVTYKVLSRQVSRATKKLEVDPHVGNSLRLTLRVVTLIVFGGILLTIFNIPPELFVGGSALVGAAIGFGSSQTINNIVAGFYVIASRPFRVKDYVRIGDVEGQIEEISINYTKLYTPSFNLLLVPNTQVMSSQVVNCTHEGFIKYTFTIDLPHGMISSNDRLIKECIEPAIEEFYNEYSSLHLRKPEYYVETSGSFARTFKFRVFFPRGDAKALFTIKPELVEKIMGRWDSLRKSV